MHPQVKTCSQSYGVCIGRLGGFACRGTSASCRSARGFMLRGPRCFADSDFHGAVRRQIPAATHGRYFHGRVYLGRRGGLDLRMRPCAPGFGVGGGARLPGHPLRWRLRSTSSSYASQHNSIHLRDPATLSKSDSAHRRQDTGGGELQFNEFPPSVSRPVLETGSPAFAGPLPTNRDSEGGPCGRLQTTLPLAPADTPLRTPRAQRPIVRSMSRALSEPSQNPSRAGVRVKRVRGSESGRAGVR